MKLHISKISGKSAIVIDTVGAQAFLIDTDLLPTTRNGAIIELDPAVLERALPYGIDISVACPDGICVDLVELQRRLYNMRIVSLEDLKANPSAINQALMSMLGAFSAEIYRNIKLAMEDYQ